MRVSFITAIAPVIWGSTYYVTRNFLPSDYPLTGSAIRALPAGLLLLALSRELPKGWWWLKTFIISSLTISGFFVLVYLSGSRLPSSIASMVMALSPLATMTMARLILSEHITSRKFLGGLLGILGVFLLIGSTQGTLDATGLLAATGGMLSSALGFVLTRKWKPPVNATTFTAWQLTCGGLTLLPITLITEGVMPLQSASTYFAFTYIVVFASIIAYICWFTGVTALPASTVSIIGLLNPLTGVLLGTLLAGETFTLPQMLGSLAIITGIWWGTTPQKKPRLIERPI